MQLPLPLHPALRLYNPYPLYSSTLPIPLLHFTLHVKPKTQYKPHLQTTSTLYSAPRHTKTTSLLHYPNQDKPSTTPLLLCKSLSHCCKFQITIPFWPHPNPLAYKTSSLKSETQEELGLKPQKKQKKKTFCS